MCDFLKKLNASSYSSTKSRKCFIIYNLEHGITTMKKHVKNEHGPNLVKYTMHKINLEGGDNSKKHKCKNRAFVTHTTIIIIFGGVKPYKKSNPMQMGFAEDLVLMIVKSYMSLSIVGNPWLRQNGVASLWSSLVSIPQTIVMPICMASYMTASYRHANHAF
jgi:hypothetical protein